MITYTLRYKIGHNSWPEWDKNLIQVSKYFLDGDLYFETQFDHFWWNVIYSGTSHNGPSYERTTSL